MYLDNLDISTPLSYTLSSIDTSIFDLSRYLGAKWRNPLVNNSLRRSYIEILSRNIYVYLGTNHPSDTSKQLKRAFSAIIWHPRVLG